MWFWDEVKLALIAALLAVSVALGWYVRSVMTENEELRTTAQQTAQDLRSVQAARVQEQAHAQNAVDISNAYVESRESNEKDLNGAIARLRDTIRLREQQLAALKRQQPQVSTNPSGNSEEAGSDFFEENGAASLRLASEADDVVNQLTACQKLLEDERK